MLILRQTLLLLGLTLLSLTIFTFTFSQPIAAQGVQFQNNTDVEIELSDKLVLRDGTPVKDAFNSTDDMLNLLVKVLFLGAGLVLFAMIIGAGLAMIQGGSNDKDKAKTTMTTAIVGLVIMLAAYWIMQILQLITGIYMGF